MVEQITVEQRGAIQIIRLQGQFIGGDETDALREELKQLTQGDTKFLIANLEGVTYLNSTALGVFISVHASFSKKGGKLALCNIHKSIENIFVMTKLNLVFDIQPTVEDAIQQFSAL